MECFVKESLLVLDYKDNVVDAIFLSDDHMTPGYAYDINISESNTGYSDLKFSMPNLIIDDEGNKVKNPRLKLLTPLVKLRYHREIYYTGKETITVREPQGYGDTTTYIDKTYSNKYPDNVIEDYVMDYIVQPVDKKRDVLKLTTSFTAIDYPRFNLSKKRVGLTISDDTLTKKEWTLYQNKPMDVAGVVKYEKWTADKFGQYSTVEEWDPENATEYPLDQATITELMSNTALWPYGLLATAFYWPIVSTARFEGQMYTKGGFLVLQLYDFYSLTTEGVEPEKHIGRYSWDWSYLTEVDSYLTPNNACNYLYHILDGTNWSVKLKEDGTPDVDIVQVEIPNPAGSTTSTTLTDHTCGINVSNSNCYNAITAVCQGLQLYPIYDCVNREVSLRAFAGKNYGLSYMVGQNISSTATKSDGEKVITKLYVSGGKDYNGDSNINIGEAERSYVAPTDNPDERDPWNPNDPEYIIKRSPYGTNYIMNFKWMYDNKWITKEEILDLYSINQKINDLNKDFMPRYTEDRLRTQQDYNDAVNDYDLKQGEYQSILNSMMNKYYNVYGKVSEGHFYAFHKLPLGTHKKDGKNWLWIGYCPKCKGSKAWSSATKPTVCPHCGNTNIRAEELYIPVYSDFPNVVPPEDPKYPYGIDESVSGPEYAPYIRGDYLKLLTTLDNYDNSLTISDYEKMISIIDPIPEDKTFAGYDFKLGDVYVRASSGNVEEWNQDIKGFVRNYGEMLDALETVNYCLAKIQELQELYDDWKAKYDAFQKEIQDKYGDYIVEGNYTNDEQPYVGLLFKEGMEASDKYAVPEITYSLDVIDSSGLIEYRQPTVYIYECGTCGRTSTYSNTHTCPYCGSDELIPIKDTYNELVHMLHSVGQIVPKAGDYVTIYDEAMGMFGIPGLITQITRTLDKPINNKIQVDTSYTDEEELVGNIITATNTVLNNADIYARTTILKADGTIDSSAIAATTDNPNASLNFVGTNGNMLLTGASLRFTDPNDSTKAIKYSGTGIFTTTTLSENEEATEWQKLITPSGINAAYLNAGQIDTKHISIMSGLSAKILMDENGLVIKRVANKAAHLEKFDIDAAKNDPAYANKWGEDNNISGFMGVVDGANGESQALVYTKGFLVAQEGSNIANWITSNDGFYHLNSNKQKDLWLSPSGISGTVNNSGTQSFMIYANGNFGVTTGGKLYAKDANIQGTITSNNVTITGGSLKIGNNFSVDNSGNLTAKNANIQGTITTTNLTASGTVNINDANIKTASIDSATLTNCNISAGQINSGVLDKAQIPNLSASKITTGKLSADRIDVDGIFAKDITATGTITGIKLRGGDINIGDGNFAVDNFGQVSFGSGVKITTNTTYTVISGSGSVSVSGSVLALGNSQKSGNMIVYKNGRFYIGLDIGPDDIHFAVGTLGTSCIGLTVKSGLIVGWEAV